MHGSWQRYKKQIICGPVSVHFGIHIGPQIKPTLRPWPQHGSNTHQHTLSPSPLEAPSGSDGNFNNFISISQLPPLWPFVLPGRNYCMLASTHTNAADHVCTDARKTMHAPLV